ncbi:MAG: hypothetical protein AAF664_14860, partial [Planctomycetota bacterium]
MSARHFLRQVLRPTVAKNQNANGSRRQRISRFEQLEHRALLAAGIGNFLPLGEPGPGGRIDSISIQPGDSSRILVGGDVLGATLSTDGGASWNNDHTGWESILIGDFTWDPSQATNPQKVWAGTASGPHFSSDAGETWELRRNGIAQAEVNSGKGEYAWTAPIEKVLYDPNNNNRVLAFEGDHRRFPPDGSGTIPNAFDGKIWTTTNEGLNWSEWAHPAPGGNIVDAEYGGGNGNTMYIAVYGQGLFRSYSDGAAGTWTPINNGITIGDAGNINVMGIATHPYRDDVLWAVTED